MVEKLVAGGAPAARRGARCAAHGVHGGGQDAHAASGAEGDDEGSEEVFGRRMSQGMSMNAVSEHVSHVMGVHEDYTRARLAAAALRCV